MKIDKLFKNVVLLLAPSWLSGFVAVAFGIILEVGAIITSHVGSSAMQQNLFAVHSAFSGPINDTGIINNISNNRVLSLAPLFIFWAGVGLIVYILTIETAKALAGTYNLGRELTFIKAPHLRLLINATEELVVRISGLILLVILINKFLHRVIPWSLAAAHNVAHSATAGEVLRVLMAVLLIVLSICLMTIAIRLISFRQRVF